MMENQITASPQPVLDFWFGTPDSPDYGSQRPEWFQKSPIFDDQAKDKLWGLYEQACAGELDAWANDHKGMLALIILLDQLSRNFHRDSPQAFAQDAKALDLARRALDAGFDQRLLVVQRCFIYMPFEHSEDLADQDLCVDLFEGLRGELPDAFLDYADKHRVIIRRFGRFPHRNAILGRESTPEEIEFLTQPGSSF